MSGFSVLQLVVFSFMFIGHSIADGLRAIGLGVVEAPVASLFFNGISRSTILGEGLNPKFPIVVKNIHMRKHGSDTDVYDEQGRFVQAKFDDIFQKHAHTHPNALTLEELSEMLNANKDPNDFKGWAMAAGEFKLLYSLGKDAQGLLQKETLMATRGSGGS